jgi:hypothetical protein
MNAALKRRAERVDAATQLVGSKLDRHGIRAYTPARRPQETSEGLVR